MTSFVEKAFSPGILGYDAVNLVYFSIILGLAYCCGELPNSFIKRRMGIPPGETSNRYKKTFIAIDHLDSSVPCLLVMSYFLNLSILESLSFLVAAIFIHFLVNYLLYMVGIRKQAL